MVDYNREIVGTGNKFCEKHNRWYIVKCPDCQPAPKYIEIEKPDQEKYNGRKKSKPWTPAPSTRNARDSTPAIIIPENCGGNFDPNAEKSLGRYHYGQRYYSKRTSDVDKSASVNNPKYYQIPDGESYEFPEHDPVTDGIDYGLELLEASFSFQDEDGIQRFNPKWKYQLTKQERLERYGR